MTTATWEPMATGILWLPSGRLARGRGLRRPDFRLPADRAGGAAALCEALERAGGERVEVACAAGQERTGTELACLALLDGVPNADAYVRKHYAPRAVETPWQRRFVSRFPQ